MPNASNTRLGDLTPEEARARVHRACSQNIQIFRDVAEANKCSLEVAAVALLITSINGNTVTLSRIEDSVDAMCGAAAMEVLGVVVKGGPQQ